MVKKKNKCTAKKKKRLAKLYTLLRSPLFFCPEFSLLLSPNSMAAFVPTLIPTPIPALVFYPRSLAILLFYCMPAFVFCLGSPNILLFCCLPASISCPRSLDILLSYYVPALATFAAFFLPYHISVSSCKIPAFLLSFFMLSLFLLLGSYFLEYLKNFVK